ncbi:MAG: Hsp20/alpha crystallin family protein [Bacteroidota bacterium]
MNTLVKSNNAKIKPAILGSLFDPILKREWPDFFGRDFIETIPSANISENAEHYTVELAAPGLKKEDFKINVEEDMITISSEKEHESKTEKKDYSRREYNYTSFYRTFGLPEGVDQDKIKAKYADGVLRIELPKRSPAPIQQGKSISIS